MKKYTYKEVYGTYGEIYEQFTEKTGINGDMIVDWRPASNIYTDLGVTISNAIVVNLLFGGQIIYSPDKEFRVVR